MANSALKEFIVTDDGEYGRITVVCPRKSCSEAFQVDPRWIQMTDHVVGRGCPWCHRWSAIPAELRIAPPLVEGLTNQRGRTVRRRKSKKG
jgi:hypothetical protein